MPSVAGSLGGLISLAFTPAVPASCLAFMNFAPPDLVQRFLNPEAITRVLRVRDARLPFYILTALGVIRTVNRALSDAALNNWSLKAKAGWQWTSELALVTGGCSGIGKCLVLGLVKKGVRVVVLDIQDLPADLAALGENKVLYFKCDLASPDDIRKTADEVRRIAGHPSIVINNAGIAKLMPMLEFPDEFLDRITAVNQHGPWRVTREFLPNMLLKNKGHIVTVASTASYCALPTSAPYAMTKAATLMFAEHLRSEITDLHKAPDIITTVVHPYWANTGMTSQYEERIKRSQQGNALLTAQDVAEPVLAQIFSCRGGQVFVPEMASFISTFKAMPTWLYSLLIKQLGSSFYKQ